VHCFCLAAGFLLARLQSRPETSKMVTWIEVEPVFKNQKDKKESHKQVVQTSLGEKVKSVPSHAYLGWQNQVVDRETAGSKQVIGQHQVQKPESSLSKLGLPLFKKTEETPESTSLGAQPEDYVPGVAPSDRTALNTKEFVFYSYFQRIRSRLDHAWVPILKERLLAYYRSGRQLATDMDHTTRVLVILNRRGEIVRVQMVSESGVNDLDEAAVDAFNHAGPFPNPPQGMVDVNNEIKIPWDFILKT